MDGPLHTPRSRRLRSTSALVAGILISLIMVACAQNGGTVLGVVVEVEGSLEQIESFTVLVEGDEMTFLPVADGEYPYPLSHLRGHVRTGQPVFVTWERRSGDLYATELRDG
jgi:hypothetical protein